MPQRIQTVLFDLDGTLVDSRSDLTDAVNAALAAVEQPPRTEAEVIPHVGNGLKMLLMNVLGPTDDETLDVATRAFSEFYEAHCVDKTTLYDGVLGGLQDLHPTTNLGIVTNKPRGFAEKIVNHLGIGDLISILIGGDTLPERKPHPAPVLKAIAAMGGAPETALILGDGHQDMEAGRAAGIRICAAKYGYGFSDMLMALKPDFAIDRFSQIKEIVLWPR